MHDAICAGIFNDLGSGSNVDVDVITKDGVEVLRNYDKPTPRVFKREKPYIYEPGTTRKYHSLWCVLFLITFIAVLTQTISLLHEKVVVTEGDVMDLY